MANIAGFPALRSRPITRAASVADNTTVSAGFAILLSASVTGTVTLTLQSGDTVVVNPAVGDNIYPFAVVKRVVGTATLASAYNLS